MFCLQIEKTYGITAVSYTHLDVYKRQVNTRALFKAYKPFHNVLDVNGVQWSIISAPTKPWARKVFPDCEEQEAVRRLWEAIFRACLLYTSLKGFLFILSFLHCTDVPHKNKIYVLRKVPSVHTGVLGNFIYNIAVQCDADFFF